MRARSGSRFIILALLGAVTAAVAALGAGSAITTANVPNGLQNPGFEAGVQNGLPRDWTVVDNRDSVKVVDAETPAEYGTYADMGNITVAPNGDALMLRLGSPKRGSENQARGSNTVSQTFIPEASSLSFSFRLFSWEHRGLDQFRFDLRSGSSSVGTLSAPLIVTMADGATRTCTGLPCAFSLDVGSNGQFVDSGWRIVEITGIPTTGAPVTLTYSAGGTESESKGTWAYFDDTTPAPVAPVARFSFALADPLEGDLIQFTDTSFNLDPDNPIVDWDWTIDGETYDATNPLIIIPDDGTYAATLRVTTADGTATEISAGQTASDGTAIPPFVVDNASPLVAALNVEALAGQPAPLVGRYADQGWLDSHTASWSVAGGSAATNTEDNLPALSTGIVNGTVTAAAAGSGTLSVEDNDGATSSANFGVTIVPDEPGRFEPDNGTATAPKLASGGSYLSYIQSEGDIDLYEIVLPGDRPLPAGTEVLVTLRDLPADFDVALLGTGQPGDATNALTGDAGRVGFETLAYARGAYARGAYARGAYARGAYARGAYARGAYARGAFQFANISLSEIGFTEVDGSEVGSTDITLDELGLSSLSASGLQLAGFSANRGTDTDTALARIDVAGTKLYVAISGDNGARSLSPYRLQIEASVPLDLEEALGTEACTGAPLVTAGATSDVVMLYDNPGAATTLIVTQRERMRSTFGMDDAAWQAMLDDLTLLAEDTSVAADVISLPSDIYNNWDNNPCDVEAANALAAEIRDEIQSRMAGVQYVVFVGNDAIVPHKRVPDETIISNERDYVTDSFIKPGRPLFTSIVQGYNLTDDYYVDATPTSWQGRELYIPDVATGRLIESPIEIRAAALAYLASTGSLNPQTAFVTGYDFFGDGAEATAASFDDKLTTTRLINEVWTANDLRCKFLGLAAGGLTNCTSSDVTALNAHFTHYGAFSANGFNTDNLDDFLGSTEVADLAGNSLAGSLVFSMGCHAGLSVPDGDSEAADPGLGIDPKMDYPQALAIQRAIMIASTGYGLGDDEGLGGTEKLLAIFSEILVSGNVGAGDALVEAKQQYIKALSAPTVYDEKSTIQTVFYGLPMYRVTTPPAPAPLRAANIVAPAGDITLTTTDGAAPVTTTVSRQQVTATDGSYYTAAGDSQSTAGRPVQPRIVRELPSTGTLVKGVLLLGATYTDIAGFDPLIARPTNEWESGAVEPQPCLASFWPSSVLKLNSLDIGGGIQQTLITTPGQFRCTSGAAPVVTGTERLYNSMNIELLRCPDTGDATAPAINTVDLRRSGADVVVTVDASDPSGLQRIIVLRIGAGQISAVQLDTALATSGEFTITVPNAAFGEAYIVQVQDGACNVALATGKGATLVSVGVDAGLDQVVVPAKPNTFTARIENYNGLVAPVSYIWEFGDGAFASQVLTAGDVTVGGDGSAIFTVQHQYDGGVLTPLVATVRVSDSAGGIGLDDIVAAAAAPDDDLDDDGVLNVTDGCPTVPDPLQLNLNGEVFLLPKPSPVFNDATNPASDRDGDACDPDVDGDGLTNTQELALFLSPFIWDTDGDRTNDGTEVACGSNPLVATSNLSGADTDNDRLPDACEVVYGTNPEQTDSDADGVTDGVEVRYWLSNPLLADTDADGCADKYEVSSVNGDRAVNSIDLAQISLRFGALAPEFRPFDANGDGFVSSIDLSLGAQRFQVCPPL